ncbi:MAG: hypothetical protein MZU95_15700 [Desulfomicrobium escambiense]|nr:hypothetical protein [Desulfomicrobium escambiense]
MVLLFAAFLLLEISHFRDKIELAFEDKLSGRIKKAAVGRSEPGGPVPVRASSSSPLPRASWSQSGSVRRGRGLSRRLGRRVLHPELHPEHRAAWPREPGWGSSPWSSSGPSRDPSRAPWPSWWG